MSDNDPRSVTRNQSFERERLRLDGRTFEHCTFVDCVFEFGGTAPVGMIHCSVNGGGWVAVGAAALTIDLLRGLYQIGLGEVVERTFDEIRGGQLRQSGSGQDKFNA